MRAGTRLAATALRSTMRNRAVPTRCRRLSIGARARPRAATAAAASASPAVGSVDAAAVSVPRLALCSSPAATGVAHSFDELCGASSVGSASQALERLGRLVAVLLATGSLLAVAAPPVCAAAPPTPSALERPSPKGGAPPSLSPAAPAPAAAVAPQTADQLSVAAQVVVVGGAVVAALQYVPNCQVKELKDEFKELKDEFKELKDEFNVKFKDEFKELKDDINVKFLFVIIAVIAMPMLSSALMLLSPTKP